MTLITVENTSTSQPLSLQTQELSLTPLFLSPPQPTHQKSLLPTPNLSFFSISLVSDIQAPSISCLDHHTELLTSLSTSWPAPQNLHLHTVATVDSLKPKSDHVTSLLKILLQNQNSLQFFPQPTRSCVTWLRLVSSSPGAHSPPGSLHMKPKRWVKRQLLYIKMSRAVKTGDPHKLFPQTCTF